MQLHVLPVGVAGEQLVGHVRHVRAHRDDLEGHDVGLARVGAAEEVGQAQPPVPALPREGEPAALGARRRVEHDRGRRPCSRPGSSRARRPPARSPRTAPARAARAAAAGPRSRRAPRTSARRRRASRAGPTGRGTARARRASGGVVGQRDALGDAAAPEGRLGHPVVGGDVGPPDRLRLLLPRAPGLGDRPRPRVPGLALGVLGDAARRPAPRATSPRATAMSSSMRRSPSKASRA